MFVDEKAAGEKTPVKVGALRLSEAMRIGASQTTQCKRGMYYSAGSACAWGAAAIGFGAGGDEDLIHIAASALHCQDNPAKAAFRKKFGISIMKANDREGWTREQIADGLESLGY